MAPGFKPGGQQIGISNKNYTARQRWRPITQITTR